MAQICMKMYDPLVWTASATYRWAGYERSTVCTGVEGEGGGGVTHALPGRNLVVVPNAGDIDGDAARPGGDVRGFGDEECARNRRTLGVVLNGDVPVDVLVVGTHAGEGG